MAPIWQALINVFHSHLFCKLLVKFSMALIWQAVGANFQLHCFGKLLIMIFHPPTWQAVSNIFPSHLLGKLLVTIFNCTALDRGAFKKKTEKVGLLDQPPSPPRDLVQKNGFFFNVYFAF